MEEPGLFFMLKSMRRSLKKFEFKWRWKSCAQESHWHVQNANSVTTTWPRIRRLIRTEWRLRSTADSARDILCTRKQYNLLSSIKDQEFSWTFLRTKNWWNREYRKGPQEELLERPQGWVQEDNLAWQSNPSEADGSRYLGSCRFRSDHCSLRHSDCVPAALYHLTHTRDRVRLCQKRIGM